MTAEEAAALARTAALNALAAVASVAGGLDAITRIVKVTCFVASAPAFTGQAQVANGASELLLRGRSARPGGTPAAPSAWRCCRSTPRLRSS